MKDPWEARHPIGLVALERLIAQYRQATDGLDDERQSPQNRRLFAQLAGNYLDELQAQTSALVEEARVVLEEVVVDALDDVVGDRQHPVVPPVKRQTDVSTAPHAHWGTAFVGESRRRGGVHVHDARQTVPLDHEHEAATRSEDLVVDDTTQVRDEAVRQVDGDPAGGQSAHESPPVETSRVVAATAVEVGDTVGGTSDVGAGPPAASTSERGAPAFVTPLTARPRARLRRVF